MNANPPLILEKLKLTLKNNSVDFADIISSLGQVKAVNKRENGERFTIEDHLRALLLAMLSKQRPWKPIMENLDKIDEIFFYYDPIKLQDANPDELVSKIRAINCGNISIEAQMKSISNNINQLRKIENNYKSLDRFVTENSQKKVIKLIAGQNSDYKIEQIGPTLAMEYLKSIGISSMKPDVHITRICGPERLDIIPSKNPEKQLIAFQKFAEEVNVSLTYLDNLFWIFGAKDFGEICSKKPKCDKCELKPYCNYI